MLEQSQVNHVINKFSLLLNVLKSKANASKVLFID